MGSCQFIDTWCNPIWSSVAVSTDPHMKMLAQHHIYLRERERERERERGHLGMLVICMLDKVSIQNTKYQCLYYIHYPKPYAYMWWSRNDGQRDQTVKKNREKMAAEVALSSCFCTRLPLPSKSSSPSSLTHTPTSPKKRAHHFSIHAKLGKSLELFIPPYSILLVSFLFAFCFCVLGQNEAEMSNFMEMGLVVLGGGDGEIKQGGKKKFITREEEPEQ